MLVFRRDVLDGGNTGRPESEEEFEDYGIVGGREVVHVLSIIFPATVVAAGKGDRWGLGLGA